ncbi:MAG: SGNH/GDSL hydrolase family protein [Planctomycetota bacterium]|jgi:lysophospholipase L1-like esterase
MRRQITILMLILSISALCFGAEFKKTPGPVELEDGDSFVFIGDSITHQCLYTQYVEDYYYTRYPAKRIHFRNAGISGDMARDVLDRFDEDIAKFKPKYATILIGMNDGEYTPFEDRIFNTYKKDMTEMLDKLEEIGVKAIPMTPTKFDLRQALVIEDKGEFEAEQAKEMHYNEVLSFFGMWCMQQAEERGLGFVNMYEPLNRLTREGRKEDPKFTLIEDTVHPGENGQLVMAFSLLRDIGAEPIVSKIHIIREGSRVKVEAENGELIDVSSDKISFSFKSYSLPWAVPSDAALGYNMTDAKNVLSRQMLRVVGLESGKYRLVIEGQEAAVYDYAELAKGVNLCGNTNMPDYQQAMEIAELNKERNDKAVRPLRDLWIQLKFRRYREAEALEEEEKEEIEEWMDDDMSVEEWKEKVLYPKAEKLEKKAKEFEDKIYEINKPKAHKYELIKI